MIKKKIWILIFVLSSLVILAGAAFSQVRETEEVKAPLVGPAGESQRISLELKGMDILDVLKLLAKKSGLNIAAGANVKGRVTIFLRDVDVWDAMRIVLETNNLAYERDGDIIKVMTARDYEMLYGKKFHEKTQVRIIQLEHARAADLLKTLNQVKTKVGKIVVDERSKTIVLIDIPAKIEEMEGMVARMDVAAVTKVFSLNYAKAEELEPKISELITKEVGSIKIDERTNKIIVTDIPKNVETIEQIIAAFDEKTLQVLIEAEIIEVALDDDYAFGIDWTSIISGDVTLARNLNISIPGTTASIVGTISPEEVSGTVQLLRRFGKTNTLSAPRIVVANNEEARILVGKKDVYITATISTTDGTTMSAPSVNYIDIGLVLSVTPTINRAGFVTMKIKPEVTDFERYETLKDAEGREIAKVPVITTTEAETTVMVKDGSTVLIAGLIKDKEVTTIDKIPFLGDIPLVGSLLFRNKSREIDKTELVIFLTPHIITDDTTSSDVNERSHSQEMEGVSEEGATFGAETSDPSPDEMSYDDYRRVVRDNIGRSLKTNCPQEAGRGKVYLSFVVSANGHLKGEPQVLSGDNQFLEAIAIKSVKDANPFPPIPGSLDKPQERFIIPITFE